MRIRSLPFALPVAALALAAETAGAQPVPAPDALRRDLIAQAERARDEGDHARAAGLAERAAVIRVSPSLSLMLAQEHAALDHAAVAHGHAVRCVADATADAALRNRDRILRLCHELVLRTEPAVPTVPAAPPVIVRNTTTAPPTLPHVAPSIGTTAPPRGESRGAGAGPWIVAGVGVLAFAAAGVAWGLNGEALSERDAACDAEGCDPSALDANARANDFVTATNVALISGVVALAAGVTWFVIATVRGGRASDAPAVRPTAWALPSGVGIGIGGSL